MRLFAPVLTGHWKQCELKDGTYTFVDWLDILEAMAVQQENEHRAADEARREAKLNRV